MMTNKLNIDAPKMYAPVYTSSLSSHASSRDLSLRGNKKNIMKVNTSSLGSLGLDSKIIKSHGPIHTSTAGSLKNSIQDAFHLDETPVSLDGRFPSKEKQVFFDENNSDQEKLFEMYDVSENDLKSSK
jgi:hypothetical protein